MTWHSTTQTTNITPAAWCRRILTILRAMQGEALTERQIGIRCGAESIPKQVQVKTLLYALANVGVVVYCHHHNTYTIPPPLT